MTSKFRIFCDEPQQPVEKDLQPPPQQPQQQGQHSKREPLAPKQHSTLQAHLKLQDSQQPQLQPLQPQPLQLHQQQSQTSSQESIVAQPPTQPVTSSSSSSTSSANSDQDQDQENDISIASLGSDFVPSIIHEEFDSFECEEEEANVTVNSWYSEGCRHTDFNIENDSHLDLRDSSLVDDDADIDLDEEAQLELSLALKKHDESTLLNCAVFKNDILEYLYDLEMDPDLRPIPNYMLFHHDIDSEKRSILVNWLVEVTNEYEQETETLFICIGIIDRFLSKMSISTNHFQLLGVAAMFMATKYEEIYPPDLYQFVEVTDETFSGKQIIQMEQEILRTLDFRISMPTVSFFLRQIFAYNKFTKKVYNLAEYLCYLSLLEDRPFLEYYPSEIALAAVILAAHQLGAAANISAELKSSYDKSNISQLNRRDAFTSPNDNNDSDTCTNNGSKSSNKSHPISTTRELPLCVESLRAMQERVPHSSAVYVKYSSEAHDQVALLPPLRAEDLHKCA